MAKELKVYGFQGFRGGKQTREIIAAYSGAEVRRRTGMSRRDWYRDAGETGNPHDRAMALAKPGSIFWCLQSQLYRDPEWHEVKTTDDKAKGSTNENP
ncbi:hypothetical protein SEA_BEATUSCOMEDENTI_88 [Arthrobacter phage BeatusComedenti]|uniref:Uncharacterized protein n=1 Tax=Arthrobacter phage BeatusComedenti TaxID=2656523 RepID=A0A649VVG5_9CAUD|nr:hypothetical protein SEA_BEATUSCOMEDENTI_88 [Arthrobacter phage BeatusComedenti]